MILKAAFRFSVGGAKVPEYVKVVPDDGGNLLADWGDGVTWTVKGTTAAQLPAQDKESLTLLSLENEHGDEVSQYPKPASKARAQIREPRIYNKSVQRFSEGLRGPRGRSQFGTSLREVYRTNITIRQLTRAVLRLLAFKTLRE